MNRDDRVPAIVLATEHLLRLAGVDLVFQFVERFREIVEHRLAGFGPLGEHSEVVDPPPERFAQVTVLLQAAAALEQLLRRLLVFPEVGVRYTRFDLGEFVCRAGGVKDSSAGPSRGA
jgi:hypothetical protein